MLTNREPEPDRDLRPDPPARITATACRSDFERLAHRTAGPCPVAGSGQPKGGC